MAEVDFGDSELFQQLDESAPPVTTHIRFTDDDEEQDERSELRSRLEECDDYIQRLTEENKILRRKMSLLTRPSGVTVEDVNTDGPLLQVLYTNNIISKKCRQEIEDCICSVILRHQKPDGEKKSSFNIKPQNSAFALDEDPQTMSSSSVRTTTEAFKVVGSVLYFTTFSVDKLGQPLVNENPQLTDGWDVPTYQQVFNQVIGTDGQEIEMKDKRPKSMCFNCGSSSHQLRDCPKPKDMAAINERRKEFNQSNNQVMQSNQRYHADEVEERFAKYKPGVMSEELLTALGIDENTLPPLIYRMRQLGYPPGWLKEAEMENSGLSLYDGNASSDGTVTDNTNSQNLSYDVSKLVDFPGFNVPAPHKMKDEFMHYGSIPMQTSHMKQNYAAYLSSFFPTQPGATSSKRRHEFDSSPQLRKRSKFSPDRTPDRSSDMDIESDPGTPHQIQSSGDFQFQPPLPPGSPCFSSPPPLPQGTPPSTPTPPPLPKGTPPPTPTNGSPAVRGRDWVVVDETGEGTEDDLTLEELEEQQRLIWAALENADMASNSDCETPAAQTPVPSSPSVSTSAHADTENEDMDEGMDLIKPEEPSLSKENQPEDQEALSLSPGPVKVKDDSPQSPEPAEVQESTPQSPEPVKTQDSTPQSPEPVKTQDSTPQSPEPVKTQDSTPQSPEPVKTQDSTPQSPEPVKTQDSTLQSPESMLVEDSTFQSPEPVKAEVDNPQSPESDLPHPVSGDCTTPGHLEKVTAVPHRSKFAAGIVPFEDTPEFTEVAEATGTYLRIRDLLKNSPRSLAKK
ncbi:zinc finger CCHC domain-containing protein 8 isoform X1 [Oreochromis aureus]|uniref:zinc finger CCHC domain-containing protein 8 isoform X1 n=1 Tax=Oreochromis aureus TaxID=47969 RepID=UPI001953C3F6|nr:zinc finger CCHC domain-containing protein 8 isoform X1 [Oreochromis aureus]